MPCQVIDHIAVDSEEYAVLVCDNGGLAAIASIAKDYSWNSEIVALCRDTENTIKMMRLRFEQSQDLSKRQQRIRKQEQRAPKNTSRLAKLTKATEELDWS